MKEAIQNDPIKTLLRAFRGEVQVATEGKKTRHKVTNHSIARNNSSSSV